MNGRYPEQPVFPSLAGAFPGYIPGTHSILTSSPRFPYNVAGGRTHQSYVPGSVVHGPSPYITHARSPSPSVFGRSSHEYSFPERRLYVPDSTTRYRARDSTGSPDPVVFNAGFTFRLGQEAATVHKHVEVQPAYTIPEAESANLTRQIDKFLKKSDHTLDRYSAVVESRSSSRLAGRRGRSATPEGALDTSPDRSLSLSCRAQRSTSAASIAVKAEKHLESLSRVTNTRKTAPIAEREEDDLGSTSSESCNEFDTDEDLLRSGDVFDISDDTSADLSKLSAIEVDGDTHCSTPFDRSRLDDLSSDSDDEYFDVVALPGLRPPPVPSPLAPSSPATKPQSPPHLPPTHSRSLPAVNKKLAASKMGNSQAQGAATAAKPPESNPAVTKPPAASAVTKPPAPSAVTNGNTNDTVHAATTKTGGKVQQTLTTNSMAQQSVTNKPSGGTTCQAPAGKVTQTSDKVGILHKKYLAPQPPATKTTVQTQQTGLPYSQEDNLSVKGLLTTPNEPQSTAPEKQQLPGKSNPVRNPSVNSVVDRLGTDLAIPKKESVAASSEDLTANVGRGSDKLGENKTGKDTPKTHRAPSFKKYPAPQPPNSSSRPQSAVLDGDGLAAVSTTSLVSASSDQSLKKMELKKVTKEDTFSSVVQSDTSLAATSTQAATSLGQSDKKNNATPLANKKPPSSEVQPKAVENKNNSNATTVQSPKKQSDSKVVYGAAVGRKVRAGSPVPDKPTVKDLKPTPAVVKGKLEISTNDGSATIKKDAPDEGKVTLQIKGPGVNKDATKPSEAGKIETNKKVNDKTPTLGKKRAKTASEEDETRLVNGFEDEKFLKPDVAITEKSHSKSSGVSNQVEKQKNSSTKENGTDITKENKVDSKKEEPQVNGSCDEVDKAKQKEKVSTSKEMSKQKSSTCDKNSEKTNSSLNITDQKICNGVHDENEPNNDNVDEASKHQSRKTSQNKESNGDVGSEERGSRCNSVASDISAAVSHDVSKKSGYKRTKSGKLASVLNLFETEDLSQASEKSKPKSSAPKVGKITGLASKFEGGAPVAPKLEVSKMKSPYSGPFSPERKAPEPKTKDIAGINMAKFGNVAKFKKPGTGGKKDEEEKTQSSSSQGESKKEDNDKSVSKEDASKKQSEGNEGENKDKSADKVGKKNEASKKIEEKEENKKSSLGDQNVAVAEKQETVALVNGDANLADSDLSSSDGIAKGKKKKAKTDAVSDVTATTVSPKISPKSKKKLGDPSSTKSKATESKTAEETEAKSEINKVILEEPKSTDVKVSDSQSVKEDEVSLPNNLSVKAGEQGLKEIGASKSETVRIVVNKVMDGEAKVINNESASSKIEKIATIKTKIHEEITKTCDTTVTINVNKDSVISSSEAAVTKAEGTNITDLKPNTTGDVAKEPKTVCDVPAVSEDTEKNGTKIISAVTTLPKDSSENASADTRDILAKSTIHRIEVPELAEIKAETVSNVTPVLAVGNSQATSTEAVSVRPKSLEPPKQELLSTNTKVESASAAPFNGEVSVREKECSVAPEFQIDNRSTDSVYSYLGEGVPNINEIDEKPVNHRYSRATCEIRRKINEVIAKTSTVLPQLESQVQAMVREASTFLESGMAGARASVSPARIPPFTRRATSIGEDDDEVFEDAIDPSQLDTLMPLPDVPAERERRSRSRTPMLDGPERSPSTKYLVAQTEALLSETDRLLHRSRSDKSLRRSYSRSLSSAALNKLAEVTADLSEEHNTAHLAGERFEAEQAERMKLEKEVERLQDNVQAMTTANGRLEEERQVLKSEVLRSEVLNGDAHDDEDEEHDTSLYRRKYQWCLREMELLKKQLKQQQEDDLDHLLLLKKQLEKKVADAYEETEEQRQVVAQMKRKSQRLQAEMNDLKILLEEQTSRNNLLEKKQRKFDQDMLGVQEELRHERANKDKVQREKDQTLSEKYSFEQEVSTLKLELELKEEKVTSLSRELADLSFTGRAEEEVAALKKAKHDLDLRVKDQEEELDDLAGQVQMLEGARVRLEMSIEQMRKENRREVTQREEELEEVRLSAQKKVKVLENQLESEHEERTLVVREKHELERRVAALQDRSITHVDEEYVVKLKKELKKTKALLRDTQTMLEKTQSEGGHKLMLRQLKTQLEDAEFAKTAAIKARQCAECDLAELGSQLEEAQRARKEAEDRCARVAKDRAEIQTQLEESEEEVAEVMKKYKAVVSQLSVDQITLSEQSQQISELEHEKQVLQDRLAELNSKVEVLEGETANIHTQRRLEMKIKEVESKLELEQTTRQRLESQIGRLKDQLERLTAECDSARMKESQAVEQGRRVGRQLREVREDLAALQQKHTDAVSKKGEVEKQLELADSEVITLKSDLKLAFKRIEDLQQAIQGDLNDSDSDLSDSDSDTDGSLSSYLTASLKHQRSSSNSTLRTPPSEVHQLDRLDQAASPSSEGMSAISEDLEDTAGKESFA